MGYVVLGVTSSALKGTGMGMFVMAAVDEYLGSGSDTNEYLALGAGCTVVGEVLSWFL
jgi:hypothetical protein